MRIFGGGFDLVLNCVQAGLVVNMTLSPAIASKIASAHDEQVRCCPDCARIGRKCTSLCGLVKLQNENLQRIERVTPQILFTASQNLLIQ